MIEHASRHYNSSTFGLNYSKENSKHLDCQIDKRLGENHVSVMLRLDFTQLIQLLNENTSPAKEQNEK